MWKRCINADAPKVCKGVVGAWTRAASLLWEGFYHFFVSNLVGWTIGHWGRTTTVSDVHPHPVLCARKARSVVTKLGD